MVETMKCPECSAPDFYIGFMGGNCIRPGCKLFKNGNQAGKAVLPSPCPETPLWRCGDLVWVDRGIGWSGKPDGFLMAGRIRSIWEDGTVMVALSWDNPAPGGGLIPQYHEWIASAESLFPCDLKD